MNNFHLCWHTLQLWLSLSVNGHYIPICTIVQLPTPDWSPQSLCRPPGLLFLHSHLILERCNSSAMRWYVNGCWRILTVNFWGQWPPPDETNNPWPKCRILCGIRLHCHCRCDFSHQMLNLCGHHPRNPTFGACWLGIGPAKSSRPGLILEFNPPWNSSLLPPKLPASLTFRTKEKSP